MAQLLSNLDIDEVSLVGKAANGKSRFLIYKNMERKKMTPPAPNEAIMKAVETALAAERRKTDAIRKDLDIEKSKRRRGEIAEFVKKHGLDVLGIEKTIDKLIAIEKSDMPKDTKKAIIADLVKSAEALKQSDLFKSYGTSQPAPNSPEAAFEAAVQERMDIVQKSAGDSPKSEQVVRSEAVAWVVKNKPGLFSAIRGGR